jgi:uncharacterized protein
LLHTDIIVRIGEAYRQIQRAHGIGGSIAITTNGSLLTAETLKLMNPVGVELYHISVDGPRELHNSQRVIPGGGNTYDFILDNIELVLNASESRVLFRVNLNTANPQLGEIVSAWLSDDIMPRYARFGERIQYHVVSIWNATTTSVEGICISDSQRFQTWFDVKKRLAQVAGKDILSALADEVSGLGTLACYAGKPNHYVIGSDGSLYKCTVAKCTVAFDLPENKVGYMTADGEMVVRQEREAIWIDANSLTDPTCSRCAFGGSCMGLHCPLTRIQTGKPPCPTQKRFVASYLAATETN